MLKDLIDGYITQKEILAYYNANAIKNYLNFT